VTKPVLTLDGAEIKQILIIFQDAQRWYEEIPALVPEDFDPEAFQRWESNWAAMERLERKMQQFIQHHEQITHSLS